MSHALSETDDMVARRRVWRGRALHSLGLFALVWVSYGSYEMVKWAGVPDPWAYLYPVIVDLGVIVVMPYSNDATLPHDGDWPVRRNARHTILFAFVAIIAFNALHTVLAALDASVVLPSWLRPVIALIAGTVPVVLYIRVMGLHSMATSWEVAEAERERREARESWERQERDVQETAERERQQQLADQREAERQAREHAASLERIRVQAEADATRESAKVSRRDSSRTPAAATRGKPAERNGNPLLDELPGKTKFEKLMALLEQQWAAGEDLNGTDAAKTLGADPKYGRQAAAALKERGVVPPSERPRLMALARN